MSKRDPSGSHTLRELRQLLRERLERSCEELNSQTAANEVTELLTSALGYSPEQLVLSSAEQVDAAKEARIEQLLLRRCAGEPLAYVLGEKEFYSRSFLVSPEVLIPRPETEFIVQRAHELISVLKPQRFFVVDVGTGSGAILLSLVKELEQSFGAEYLARGSFLALDLSRGALKVAQKNAQRFFLQDKICFAQADLLSAVSSLATEVEFFLCLSNPPYIPETEPLAKSVQEYEPKLALRSGVDGLDAIRGLIKQFAVLQQSGADAAQKSCLLLEFGYDQGIRVESLARDSGLGEFRIYKDLQGISRVVEIACPKSFA